MRTTDLREYRHLAWMHMDGAALFEAAGEGYRRDGRGVLTISQPSDYPGDRVYVSDCVAQERLRGWPTEVARMVRRYDPAWEMVLLVLDRGWPSTYLVRVGRGWDPYIVASHHLRRARVQQSSSREGD